LFDYVFGSDGYGVCIVIVRCTVVCILEDMDFELRLGHRMWILEVNFVIKLCNESQFLGFLVY
jgi:hypothetical protein